MQESHISFAKIRLDSEDSIESLSQETFKDLTALEIYSFDVVRSLMNIFNAFQRVEHLKVYITNYRNYKKYIESGINKSNDISYHYNYHAVLLSQIFDISLILTNKVLCLGLPDKECRYGIIVNNTLVKSIGVDRLFRETKPKIEHLQKIRNIYVHRGKERTYKITPEFEMALFAFEMGMLKGVSKEFLTRLDKLRLRTIISELESQENDLKEFILELFTKLLPAYEGWVSLLKLGKLKTIS